MVKHNFNCICRIPEIESCGQTYGKLVLYAKSALSKDDIDEVEHLLKKHNYGGGFRVKLVQDEKKKQVNNITIEPGHRIQTASKYGTKGCFAFISKKPLGKTSKEKQRKLYAITCAHCCDSVGSKVECEIYDSPGQTRLVTLGTVSYVLERGKVLDIAAIEVSQEVLNHIPRLYATELKRSNEILSASCSSLYSQIIPGDKVHKMGATTGLTKGIVVSTNNLQSHDELDNDYTILVERVPDVPVQESGGDDPVTGKYH